MNYLFAISKVLKCWIVLLILLIVHPAWAGDGAMQQVDPNQDPFPEIDITQRLGEQLPMDTKFKDDHGNTITLAEAANGKPFILVMAYYRCPMLCTEVLNELVRSMKLVRSSIYQDYNVITISINKDEGWVEAGAKKKVYVEEYGRPNAEKGWHFLTGKKDAIDKICDAVGFRYQKDPETKDYIHSSGITLLSSEGIITRYFLGKVFPSDQLSLGLSDASHGKIGSLVEKLKLLCYMSYDPNAKRYTMSVWRLTQTLCAITVFGLATYVLVLLFRKNNHRHRIAADDYESKPTEAI